VLHWIAPLVHHFTRLLVLHIICARFTLFHSSFIVGDLCTWSSNKDINNSINLFFSMHCTMQLALAVVGDAQPLDDVRLLRLKRNTNDLVNMIVSQIHASEEH
jgi:hypothetical protein